MRFPSPPRLSRQKVPAAVYQDARERTFSTETLPLEDKKPFGGAAGTSLDGEETALSGEELILFSYTSEDLSVIWEGFDDFSKYTCCCICGGKRLC